MVHRNKEGVPRLQEAYIIVVASAVASKVGRRGFVGYILRLAGLLVHET